LSSEDEELAELGRLLEINIGEALGLGIKEVQRRWCLSSNNAAEAVGSWEVFKCGGREEVDLP
jgi:hypothetical protein